LHPDSDQTHSPDTLVHFHSEGILGEISLLASHCKLYFTFSAMLPMTHDFVSLCNSGFFSSFSLILLLLM
jgi:hypothetical protein